MKRFLQLTFRPFFDLTGFGIALAFLFAFWPQWATENVGKLVFVPEYTIPLQHGGPMMRTSTNSK